jgi:hypothetical protein
MDPHKMTAHFCWEDRTVWQNFATNYALWFVVTCLNEPNMQVAIVILPFTVPFPVALVSEGTWFITSRGSGESTVADSSKNPSSCPEILAIATAPSPIIF